MPQFDDREKGQEAKFAHDSELQFKAEARRNRMLGMWAAEQLGMTGADASAYATSVVNADFAQAGEEDVFKKVAADLKAKGAPVSDATIRSKMSELRASARAQVLTEG